MKKTTTTKSSKKEWMIPNSSGDYVSLYSTLEPRTTPHLATAQCSTYKKEKPRKNLGRQLYNCHNMGGFLVRSLARFRWFVRSIFRYFWWGEGGPGLIFSNSLLFCFPFPLSTSKACDHDPIRFDSIQANLRPFFRSVIASCSTDRRHRSGCMDESPSGAYDDDDDDDD